MDRLFIKVYQRSDTNISVNIETLVILSVYQIAKPENFQIIVTLVAEPPDEPLVTVDVRDIKYQIVSHVPDVTANCVWPIIVREQNIVAGLCSVARQLIKKTDKKEIRGLLGFREASLLACSESSIWTRFCEVDMIRTAKRLTQNKYYKSCKFYLPEDVARFEFHMSKPVRMHNIYKAAREKNNNKDITKIPIDKLNLDHAYGEGTAMTLADVILYPCFKILLNKCPLALLQGRIPLTLAWFEKMNESFLSAFQFTLPEAPTDIFEIIEPNFVRQSLYTADPSRYKPERRIYTKQNDIEQAFKVVSALENDIDIVNDLLPFGHEIYFNWSDVPLEANPNGGALPKKRANRKCEQLENLAKAVVKLAKDEAYKIVDFCSGSGHLGILLAVLLPRCEVILVENKEQSLARAKERIDKLGLENVVIVQSNLDYFLGSFDIGVSLHACGVATDLVIQNCINNEAHFVSCPCCYGGVKDCYHLKYPRSEQFQKLKFAYKDYLSLAHAADQTHDAENVKTKQGYLCMDIVDTDRKLYAERCGYEVFLGKLQPTSCTNKNNLLVGFYKGKR